MASPRPGPTSSRADRAAVALALGEAAGVGRRAAASGAMRRSRGGGPPPRSRRSRWPSRSATRRMVTDDVAVAHLGGGEADRLEERLRRRSRSSVGAQDAVDPVRAHRDRAPVGQLAPHVDGPSSSRAPGPPPAPRSGRWARSMTSGSVPRSNRADASVRSLSRRRRAGDGEGRNHAISSSTSTGAVVDLGVGAAHDPGDARWAGRRRRRSAGRRRSAVRSTLVQRHQRLAVRAPGAPAARRRRTLARS